MSEGILWACICRDETILAEAGEDRFGGQVTELAQRLLNKPATAGWEYQRSRAEKKLRGIKFHVYDRPDPLSTSTTISSTTNSTSTTGSTAHSREDEVMMVWVFACIYDDRSVKRDQAQSFLEKMVVLTQMMRDEDVEWRQGTQLAAQESFAPILLQRMQEVSYRGRMAMVNDKVETCREVMSNNIDMLMEREEKLAKLDEDATRLQEMASQFKKGARRIKRFKMWQNAKHGVLIGSAVTAGVAVIVVPPLIALL